MATQFPVNITPQYYPGMELDAATLRSDIGNKVDATNGQLLAPTINGGTLVGVGLDENTVTLAGQPVTLSDLFLTSPLIGGIFDRWITVWVGGLPTSAPAVGWWLNPSTGQILYSGKPNTVVIASQTPLTVEALATSLRGFVNALPGRGMGTPLEGFANSDGVITDMSGS